MCGWAKRKPQVIVVEGFFFPTFKFKQILVSDSYHPGRGQET